MKNITRLLFCITFASAIFIIRAENLDTQISTETGQETPNTISAKSESDIGSIDKSQPNPQNILNTINNVVNMVQTANNLVNQVIPTDNTITKTTQQNSTTQQNVNAQNILATTQNVINIVQSANDLIDQILPIDDTTGTNEQIVNSLSTSEAEKWKYVNNYFAASIGDLNSYEKIGEFISQNAKFLSMPAAILYKFLAEKVLTKLVPSTTTDSATEAATTSSTPAATTKAKKNKSLKSKALDSSLNFGARSIKYITAPIIGGLLTYRIIKFIGAKIGTKTTKCNTALIAFAKDWDQHKDQTPEILWSLFEQLNKELVDNNGKLQKIDAALAQKIIEAIATNASIYESIS
ncbi:MAG: hypothetical protein V1646_04865 [bacterium]